ncbi:uncharacterized protein LOC118280349 isoform X2 [Spodoptera frugiperda]|uniref:Uncharacterized protein LOC118280349 isoform X2 n=1 Tax=Spodoptera frugiperda TaxID=7108 RepID=A0A9R0E3I2_SPOFR|nr:uncharacterized protein LOC118280349 isoform X2 [Spodoptera frugiperda]
MFNMDVLLLLVCTCFAVIKSEGNQDVEVFAACPKSPFSALITDKYGVLILENYNKILIGLGLFGIIVLCQTLFIVYIIRKKLVGRYRDISKRPPQPLPLDIYDVVAPEDEPELGFTNRAFNMADERTSPNVARKLPRGPPHRRLRPAPNVVRKPPKALPCDSFGQDPNGADKRIAPDVPRKQSHELFPGSPSKEMRLRALKPTNLNQGKRPRPYPCPRPRPKAKAPQELNTLEQRLTWEDDWQYEKLDPMQKYL